MKKYFIIFIIVFALGAICFSIFTRGACKNSNELNKINKNFMFKKITPNIMVLNVNATVDYYKNILGFNPVMGVDGQGEVKMGDEAGNSDLVWAMIKRDEVEIMIQGKDSFVKELPELKDVNIGGTFTMYIGIKNVNEFYDKVKSKVDIIKDIHKTFYGTDEFVIKDPNGYIIYFAEAQNG